MINSEYKIIVETNNKYVQYNFHLRAFINSPKFSTPFCHHQIRPRGLNITMTSQRPAIITIHQEISMKVFQKFKICYFFRVAGKLE